MSFQVPWRHFLLGFTSQYAVVLFFRKFHFYTLFDYFCDRFVVEFVVIFFAVSMSKVSFGIFVSSKINKKGCYPIKLNVYFNYRSTLVSTPYFALKSEVTFTKGVAHLKPKSTVAVLAGSYVDSFRRAAMVLDPATLEGLSPNAVYALVNEKRSRYLKESGPFRLDFPDYARKVISGKKDSTGKTYEYAMRTLCKYFGREHFDISEITSSRLKAYEAFLIERLGRTPTVGIYLGAVSHIHRKAQREFNNEELGEVCIRDPFRYFEREKVVKKVHHYDISRESVQYLIDNRNRFPSWSATRKGIDLFLLIFSLQGMNVADMLEARAPVDGIITYNRRKTRDQRPDDAETKVRIEEEILPVYLAHRDPDGVLAFDYGKGCKLNSFHMKAVEWMRGVRELLSSGDAPAVCRKDAERIRFYSARHTYATVSCSLGIDKALVNDGLVHKDPGMAMTDFYVRVDWSRVWDANRMLIRSFDWSSLKE